MFLAVDGPVGTTPPIGIDDPLTLYDISELVDFVNRTRGNYFNALSDENMLSMMYN